MALFAPASQATRKKKLTTRIHTSLQKTASKLLQTESQASITLKGNNLKIGPDFFVRKKVYEMMKVYAMKYVFHLQQEKSVSISTNNYKIVYNTENRLHCIKWLSRYLLLQMTNTFLQVYPNFIKSLSNYIIK